MSLEAAGAKAEDAPGVVESIIQQEGATRLRQCLELLPENYRTVVELRDHEGLSFAEIGEALGVSEDAAKKRYARAVHALGRLLRQRGMESS